MVGCCANASCIDKGWDVASALGVPPLDRVLVRIVAESATGLILFGKSSESFVFLHRIDGVFLRAGRR